MGVSFSYANRTLHPLKETNLPRRSPNSTSTQKYPSCDKIESNMYIRIFTNFYRVNKNLFNKSS